MLNFILSVHPVYVFGGLIGALIGCISSYSTIKEIIRIQRIPTDYVSALPSDGLVEVVGRAECEKTLSSPLTQKTCVIWQVIVSEEVSERTNGYRSTTWITRYKDTSEEPFTLNDGTGKIQIHPADAKLVLHYAVNEFSGFLQSVSPQIQGALENLGINTTGFLGLNKTLQIREYIIEPGKQIYVLGNIGYTDGIRSIVTEESTPLVISDRSEKELLSAFYWRLTGNIFFGALIVIGLLFFSQ